LSRRLTTGVLFFTKRPAVVDSPVEASVAVA
jgi:hypothetical protein